MMHPFRYLYAILFREIIYKRKKAEMEVLAETFFGIKMHLLLPSSTDIFLTGGKSHDSEIRLAKFLIHNLEPGDTFMDVGAHYGYFSLLGSVLTGAGGKVYSFEASPKTYRILQKNTGMRTNMHSNHLAVSDSDAELKFYEFPNLYSEYNTLNIDQFKNEKWFSAYEPTEVKVKSVILDEFITANRIDPKVIKIDVEGAEYRVINGLSHFLLEKSPLIVMEYLSQARGNKEHQEAEAKLNALGYLSFAIDDKGALHPLESVPSYLEERKLESDNIVFAKQIS